MRLGLQLCTANIHRYRLLKLLCGMWIMYFYELGDFVVVIVNRDSMDNLITGRCSLAGRD